MTSREGHISAPLTTLSERFENEEYIGDISKRIKVLKQADKIKVYDKSHLRIETTLIGESGEANIWKYDMATDKTYFCEEYGLKNRVTEREKKNYDKPLDAMADTTEALTDIMALDREYRISAAWRNTTTMASYMTTLSGTSQWSDYDNGQSFPIVDLKEAITTCRDNGGHTANSIIMDWKSAITLVAHPTMVDIVKGNTPVAKAAVLKVIKDLFDLDPIIGKAMYNSAAEGATDALSPVWGKDVLLAYVNPKPRLKSETFGATFDNGGRRVKTWVSEDPDGTWIRVKEEGLDDKVLLATNGYLLVNAIA